MRLVRTNTYVKALKRLRASREDIAEMEQAVCERPERGAVIPGLSGVRKARFAMSRKGKSGGGRVVYFVPGSGDLVLLLTAFSKSEKTDLTPADRKAVMALLEEWENG